MHCSRRAPSSRRPRESRVCAALTEQPVIAAISSRPCPSTRGATPLGLERSQLGERLAHPLHALPRRHGPFDIFRRPVSIEHDLRLDESVEHTPLPVARAQCLQSHMGSDAAGPGLQTARLSVATIRQRHDDLLERDLYQILVIAFLADPRLARGSPPLQAEGDCKIRRRPARHLERCPRTTRSPWRAGWCWTCPRPWRHRQWRAGDCAAARASPQVPFIWRNF